MTRACPFCGKPVLAEARKCRHCRDWIDPRGALEGRARWVGDRLVLQEGMTLPGRTCWICGEDEGGDVEPRPARLSCVPRRVWVVLGAGTAAGVLVGAWLLFVAPDLAWLGLGGIAPGMMLLGSRAEAAYFEFPACASCRRGWWLSELAAKLCGIFGVLLPIMGGVVGGKVGRDREIMVGIFAGLAAWPLSYVALQVLLVRRLQVTAVQVRDREVTLRLPNPEAVRGALSEERRR